MQLNATERRHLPTVVSKALSLKGVKYITPGAYGYTVGYDFPLKGTPYYSLEGDTLTEYDYTHTVVYSGQVKFK